MDIAGIHGFVACFYQSCESRVIARSLAGDKYHKSACFPSKPRKTGYSSIYIYTPTFLYREHDIHRRMMADKKDKEGPCHPHHLHRLPDIRSHLQNKASYIDHTCRRQKSASHIRQVCCTIPSSDPSKDRRIDGFHTTVSEETVR